MLLVSWNPWESCIDEWSERKRELCVLGMNRFCERTAQGPRRTIKKRTAFSALQLDQVLRIKKKEFIVLQKSYLKGWVSLRRHGSFNNRSKKREREKKNRYSWICYACRPSSMNVSVIQDDLEISSSFKAWVEVRWGTYRANERKDKKNSQVRLSSHEKKQSGQSETILDLVVLLTLEEENVRLRTYCFQRITRRYGAFGEWCETPERRTFLREKR